MSTAPTTSPVNDNACQHELGWAEQEQRPREGDQADRDRQPSRTAWRTRRVGSIQRARYSSTSRRVSRMKSPPLSNEILSPSPTESGLLPVCLQLRRALGSILRMHRMRWRCEPDGSGAGKSDGQVPAPSVIMALRRRRSSPERAAQAVTRSRRSRRCRPARAHGGTRALGFDVRTPSLAAISTPPITPPASPSSSPPGSCAANSIRHRPPWLEPGQPADAGGRQRPAPTRRKCHKTPQDNRRAQTQDTRHTNSTTTTPPIA